MNLKLGTFEASLASCDKVIATWLRYEKYVLVLNIHKVTIVFSLFFANCANATTRNCAAPVRDRIFAPPGFAIMGKVGYSRHFFCIFNHCYFNLSPKKLKICHTIKQLYIHNIVPKYENNALHKKFYNRFKKGTFSVECAPCMLTASPLFSHSNYPLSLHGKTNLMVTKYSMKPMQYAEIHALP